MTQELSRSLAPRHITMISLGGIIGAGLFVSSSAAIAAAGPGVLLSYLLTGGLLLLVMRMLGEMALARPDVRSFTEFSRAGLGDWGGFVAGWVYWYFWIIVVPVEAIAGANILQGWMPPGLPVTNWEIGLALMALMTGVNLLSARSYGEAEFWFASVKVAAIVTFIAFGAACLLGWLPHGEASLANLTSHGGFAPHGWIAVLAAAATVYFSLTGAEITTIAAVESKEPARAVASLTTSVILRVLIFYVLSMLVILTVVPWTFVEVGKSPFTLALTRMDFGWASTAMSVIILTAVLSCLNSAFYVCSRVLFVLAERGDAPGWLVKLNARKVPTRSVWMGSLAGVVGIIANILSPQHVFAFLVNASGALIVFVYMMTALSQIRLRRARERAGEPAPALTMWLFPWLSYLAVAAMFAILVAMALSPEHAIELQASLLSFAVAFVAYWLVRAVRSPRPAPAHATDPGVAK
jgi:AAT family amino acid transporter/GABA permease